MAILPFFFSRVALSIPLTLRHELLTRFQRCACSCRNLGIRFFFCAAILRSLMSVAFTRAGTSGFFAFFFVLGFSALAFGFLAFFLVFGFSASGSAFFFLGFFGASFGFSSFAFGLAFFLGSSLAFFGAPTSFWACSTKSVALFSPRPSTFSASFLGSAFERLFTVLMPASLSFSSIASPMPDMSASCGFLDIMWPPIQPTSRFHLSLF